MVGLIFIIFFIVLLPLGFSMITAYGFAFVIPVALTGGNLYGVYDIVAWLVDAAGRSTYVAIALFVVSGNMMSKGKLSD